MGRGHLKAKLLQGVFWRRFSDAEKLTRDYSL
jgi:hypothetical protein